MARQLDRPEAIDEALRHLLAADLRPVEEPREGREDLPRIERLDEVVLDVGAEGLAKRRRIFALGHHDDREARLDLAQVAIGLEPPLAGHLLVEQDDVDRVACKHRHRVVGVGGRQDVVAVVAQKQAVAFEQLRFVVHPEDGAPWTRHAES